MSAIELLEMAPEMINSTQKDLDDFLFSEAEYDCWQNVFCYLNQGYDVDSLSKANKTLLHYALDHQNEEAFVKLIEDYQADVHFALMHGLNTQKTYQILLSRDTKSFDQDLKTVCKTLSLLFITPNSGLARMHQDYPDSYLDPIDQSSSKQQRKKFS